MAASETADVIEPDQLRPVDRVLLSYLREGRVIPSYCRDRMLDEMDELEGIDKEYSRGYIQQRLSWFVDHGHAVNLYDDGLYELVDDPEA